MGHQMANEKDRLVKIYEQVKKTLKCPYCEKVVAAIYDIFSFDGDVIEEFSDELLGNAEDDGIWVRSLNSVSFCDHVLYYREWSENTNEECRNIRVIEKILKEYSELVGVKFSESEFEWGRGARHLDLLTNDLVPAAQNIGYEIREGGLFMYGDGSLFGHEFLFYKPVIEKNNGFLKN